MVGWIDRWMDGRVEGTTTRRRKNRGGADEEQRRNRGRMDGCMDGMDGLGAKGETMTTTRRQLSDGKGIGSMVWAFHRH